MCDVHKVPGSIPGKGSRGEGDMKGHTLMMFWSIAAAQSDLDGLRQCIAYISSAVDVEKVPGLVPSTAS